MNIKIELSAEALAVVENLTKAINDLGEKLDAVENIEGAIETVVIDSLPEAAVLAEKTDDPCVPEPEKSPETKAEEPSEEGPTFKEVRAMLLESTKAHGRDAVFEVLSGFKVDKFPDLDEARYPELLKKLKALGG